jgi:hypothetical protein
MPPWMEPIVAQWNERFDCLHAQVKNLSARSANRQAKVSDSLRPLVRERAVPNPLPARLVTLGLKPFTDFPKVGDLPPSELFPDRANEIVSWEDGGHADLLAWFYGESFGDALWEKLENFYKFISG